MHEKMGKLRFAVRQYGKHKKELRETWNIVRSRQPEQLEYGIIEHISLVVLELFSFITLVNVVVFILRLATCWNRTKNDHLYIEVSVIVILACLTGLHVFPGPVEQGGVWSVVIKILVCWILVDVVLVLVRIVFLNQYRAWVGGTPLSINRSILLLIANFAQIVLCFSILYLSTQSIAAGGSSGSPIICSLQSLYFSVVTITTLGYGDFCPANSLGQGLVIVEVFIGFVFVVLIFGHFVQLSRK